MGLNVRNATSSMGRLLSGVRRDRRLVIVRGRKGYASLARNLRGVLCVATF